MRLLHEFKDNRSLEARFAGATGGRYTAPGRRAETDLAETSLALSGRLGRGAAGARALGCTWGRNSRIRSDLAAGVSW